MDTKKRGKTKKRNVKVDKVAKLVESEEATAIQQTHEDGQHETVGIWDLHVHIIPDGKFWFAQGLEIDYAVQGDSIEEAKRNFEEGLEATIDLHLRMDGNIERLLKFAPPHIIKAAFKSRLNGSIQTYSQVSLHDTGRKTSSLPFERISYLVEAAAA